MPAATLSDVEISLGRSITDPAEMAQVDQWLSDAELLIGARLGDVTLLNQATLAYVEREAVLLKMRNPDGYQSETIDDYTYRHGESRGRVSILDEWWDMLTPDGASSGFTIRPYGKPGWTEPDTWISTTEQAP